MWLLASSAYRTIEMYKFVFITPATSISSSVWEALEETGCARTPITNIINVAVRDHYFFPSTTTTTRVGKALASIATRRGIHISRLQLTHNGKNLSVEDRLGDIAKDGEVVIDVRRTGIC